MQIGEVAQLRGDGTRQLVVLEVQPLQIGEVAECRGDGARQLVDPKPTAIARFQKAPEVQHCHMRAGDGDAIPLADGTLWTPVERSCAS